MANGWAAAWRAASCARRWRRLHAGWRGWRGRGIGVCTRGRRCRAHGRNLGRVRRTERSMRRIWWGVGGGVGVVRVRARACRPRRLGGRVGLGLGLGLGLGWGAGGVRSRRRRWRCRRRGGARRRRTLRQPSAALPRLMEGREQRGPRPPPSAAAAIGWSAPRTAAPAM